MKHRFFRLLPAMLALLLGNCGEDKPLTRFENTPPSILSITAAPDTVVPGDTVLVVCEAYDPDPDHLTYSWWAGAGEFTSFIRNRSLIEWQAPMDTGSVVIRVTVSDQRDSTSGEVEVRVVEIMGHVSGRVRDAGSGQGLGGAIVTIAGRSVQTAEDGGYELGRIPLGLQPVTARKAGFHDYTGEVEVADDPVLYDIPLVRKPPVTRLTGVVRDTTLSPLGGAICRIAGRADTTDAEGWYELADLPRGEHLMEVSRPGYETFRQNLDLHEEEQTFDVVLRVGSPDPPRNVRALKDDDLVMTVRWDPPEASEGIAGYALYRTENGTRSRVPGTIPAGAGEAVIGGTENHTYFFEVVSMSAAGAESDFSAPSNLLVLVRPSVLVSIPAGQFVMGNYPEAYGNDTHPGNPVHVDAFQIESVEVTNRQFLAFLLEANSTGHLRVVSDPQSPEYGVWLQNLVLLRFMESRIDPDASQGFRIAPGFEDHPVVGVTWYGASEYALHLGRRLPTEAEWEKAARGVSSANGTFGQTGVGVGTRHPWGMQDPDASRANYGNSVTSTQPVASYPAGATPHWPGAIHDMAGNVWEWCLDWYAPYTSPHTPPGNGSGKIVRGGGYSSPASELRCGHRRVWPPVTAGLQIGFRCAR